jgi:pilus assembly protein CpaE
MRISIVSSDPRQVHAIQGQLAACDKRHIITCLAGGPDGLQAAFAGAPDIIILAEAGAMQSVLARIDALTTRHPAVQVVLAAKEQSPEFLRAAMRAGAREVLPLPLTNGALSEALANLEKKAASVKKTRDNGKVFAFIGCKGGAGTTFLATNWAHTLASHIERRVAFIDLNRQFGDALFYVSDETPPMDLADLAREAKRLDASLLTGSMVAVAPNFHLLAAAETPEKAQAINAEEVAALLKYATREYDAVILDVGNVVDEVSALAMDVADRVFPVLQATLPYLRAASRLSKVLKAYPRDKVEWIVNRYEEQGDVSLRDVERALHEARLRTIAGNFRTVSASINQGLPLVQVNAQDRVVRDLQTWAASVFPHEVVPRKSNWIQRWIGRSEESQGAPLKG